MSIDSQMSKLIDIFGRYDAALSLAPEDIVLKRDSKNTRNAIKTKLSILVSNADGLGSYGAYEQAQKYYELALGVYQLLQIGFLPH